MLKRKLMFHYGCMRGSKDLNLHLTIVLTLVPKMYKAASIKQLLVTYVPIN